MARIIELFPGQRSVKERICDDCENAMFGSYGVYCEVYGEHIDNSVKAAKDCEMYEEVPTGEAVLIGLKGTKKGPHE